MNDTITNGLQIIGALSLGYMTYLVGKVIIQKVKTIQSINPLLKLRKFIRQEVLKYLQELQNEN